MQFKNVALVAAATAATVSAEGYTPGQPWSTLTPSATLACGFTDYASTFGIAVEPITASDAASKAKRNVISQIGDGQIQATATKATTTLAPTTKASSSKASSSSSKASSSTSSSCKASATVEPRDNSCKNSGTLSLTLKDGVLTDSKGRFGSIVQGRQFQFDGPSSPQAGAIYAKGWSIDEDGYLALGDSNVFYQCLSGDFYNLYDQSIAPQCSPIHLEIVSLVDC
ncbi:hypothetical protein DAKH74_014870 [Maudiozyma humilis]|uniref:Cell wall mannoprotein PIR1-like C-terminal domain-containing protein n=1 Tax=Maudiozyma humilis TaxID=51915 RepID=A0AAV5RTK7_MAUHU|nr:hypothetical protein DAKH74_014870 [Kazachstania humilis]